MTPVIVLVVAKAPVPGLAKTRLAAAVGDEMAADIAAAALLDTLAAVAEARVAGRVVAMTGDLHNACRSSEISERLAAFTVVGQRGEDFAERLANAHIDAAAAAGRLPVLQIGMDTPQVTAELLTGCAQTLLTTPALLGMACDGGWWVLGVADAASAECLRQVPMSRADTGAVTLAALRHTVTMVTLVEELHDVDTIDDIPSVRAACRPTSFRSRGRPSPSTCGYSKMPGSWWKRLPEPVGCIAWTQPVWPRYAHTSTGSGRRRATISRCWPRPKRTDNKGNRNDSPVHIGSVPDPFDLSTARMSEFWPASHSIGASPFEAVVMEPAVGGRWFERSADGVECPWGRVLAWDPPHRVVLAGNCAPTGSTTRHSRPTSR